MQKRLTKSIPEFLLWLLPVLLILPFTLSICTDSFYMIATGKYIVENGAPKTNPFLVVDGLDIAIQNWLYCIVQYAFSMFHGLIGIQILSVLQYLLFSFSCFHLIKKMGCNRKEAFAFTVFANITMVYVMRAARPAVLTFCWLLFIIYALDKYRKRHEKLIFLILPLASIFTANIQSSNLVFLFCPVIAWGVAWVSENLLYIKRKGWPKSLFLILLATCISIAAAFINPYGIENVLYLFHSLGHVEAPELAAISFESLDVLFVFLGIGVILSIFIDMVIMADEIDFYYGFLLVGFSILSYTCKRNLLFLIPALMPVWDKVCNLFTGFKQKICEERFKAFCSILNHNPLTNCAIVIAFSVFLAFWTGQLLMNRTAAGDIIEQVSSMPGAGDLLKYFSENNIDPEYVSVWPGDAAAEMFGAKVLLEPRLEVEDSLINHKEDLYTEYTKVLSQYDKSQIDKYFKNYDFDYYIAETGNKMSLYFEMSENYEPCEKTDAITIYRFVGRGG